MRHYSGFYGSMSYEVGVFVPIRVGFLGARLPFSPKWQSSLSANYILPLVGVNLTMVTTISSQSKSLGVLAITNADKDLYEVNGCTLVSARFGVGADRKSTRLNSSHSCAYRLPSSA